MQLRIEYDCDGDVINAELWDGEDFVEQLSDHRHELAILGTLPIESGRWDGEASTNLCPAYQRRPCTSGGIFEIYEVIL